MLETAKVQAIADDIILNLGDISFWDIELSLENITIETIIDLGLEDEAIIGEVNINININDNNNRLEKFKEYMLLLLDEENKQIKFERCVYNGLKTKRGKTYYNFLMKIFEEENEYKIATEEK